MKVKIHKVIPMYSSSKTRLFRKLSYFRLRLFTPVCTLFLAWGFSNTASGQCALSGGAGPLGVLSPTSGNAYLDQRISQELYQISTDFGVRPGFKFFDDNQGPNAFAFKQAVVLNWPDGTIIFGIRLLQEQLVQSALQGYAVPAIIAHEFGHIVQFQEKAVPDTTVRKELQADYLAGWYMGKRQGILPANTNVEQVMLTFYSKGSYDFNNPNFHGTPQQRVSALMKGVADSGMGFHEVYSASLLYVNGNNDDHEGPKSEPTETLDHTELTCAVTQSEIERANISRSDLDDLKSRNAHLIEKEIENTQDELRDDLKNCREALSNVQKGIADSEYLEYERAEIARTRKTIRAFRKRLAEIE